MSAHRPPTRPPRGTPRARHHCDRARARARAGSRRRAESQPGRDQVERERVHGEAPLRPAGTSHVKAYGSSEVKRTSSISRPAGEPKNRKGGDRRNGEDPRDERGEVGEASPLVAEGIGRQAGEACVDQVEGPEARAQVACPAHRAVELHPRVRAVELRVVVDRVERIPIGQATAQEIRPRHRHEHGQTHRQHPPGLRGQVCCLLYSHPPEGGNQERERRDPAQHGASGGQAGNDRAAGRGPIPKAEEGECRREDEEGERVVPEPLDAEPDRVPVHRHAQGRPQSDERRERVRPQQIRGEHHERREDGRAAFTARLRSPRIRRSCRVTNGKSGSRTFGLVEALHLASAHEVVVRIAAVSLERGPPSQRGGWSAARPARRRSPIAGPARSSARPAPRSAASRRAQAPPARKMASPVRTRGGTGTRQPAATAMTKTSGGTSQANRAIGTRKRAARARACCSADGLTVNSDAGSRSRGASSGRDQITRRSPTAGAS